MRRITVNLAPADMKKEGPSYDLPIAVGILTSSGQLEEQADSALYLGELSLDGSTRHTKGVLPMVAMAKDEGFAQVFLPAKNAREGSLVEGITVMPVSSLAELVSHLTGESAIEAVPDGPPAACQGIVRFLGAGHLPRKGAGERQAGP